MLRRLLAFFVGLLHVVVLAVPLSTVLYALGEAVGVFAAGSIGANTTASTVGAARWVVLLRNTGVVCGAALATALPLATLGGLLLARTDLLGRRLAHAAVILTACLPLHVGVIFVLAWLPAGRWSGSALCCGVLYGLFHTPLATVLLGATFRAADRELEDLALLDAGPLAVLFRVTLPLAAWGYFAASTVLLLLVATDYTLTDLLLVRTFAEEVYTQFNLDRRRLGPVLTAVPVFFFLAAMLLAWQHRCRFLTAGEWRPSATQPPQRFRLSRWRLPLSIAAWALGAVVAGLPLAAVLRRIESWSGFFLAARSVTPELLLSGAAALTAALLVASSSIGLAWATARGGWRRWPTWVAILTGLALPAPVVGISLIGLLDRDLAGTGWPAAIYDSPAVLVLGLVARFLPLGVVLAMPAVLRVPKELEWLARLDGCGVCSVWRQVYWPLGLRQAVWVLLITTLLGFGEVGATVLLAPPGWEPASVRAFGLMHFGVYQDLAALGLLSILTVAIPWAGLQLLLRGRNGVADGPPA